MIKATPKQALGLARANVKHGADSTPALMAEILRQLDQERLEHTRTKALLEQSALDRAASVLEAEAFKPSETHPLVTPAPRSACTGRYQTECNGDSEPCELRTEHRGPCGRPHPLVTPAPRSAHPLPACGQSLQVDEDSKAWPWCTRAQGHSGSCR